MPSTTLTTKSRRIGGLVPTLKFGSEDEIYAC
jgi:hypothetical protein